MGVDSSTTIASQAFQTSTDMQSEKSSFPPTSSQSSKTKLDGLTEPSDVTPSEAPTEYPTGFRRATIVVALVLAQFLGTLDLTILATAIPRITDEFHSLDDVGWYGSVFFMTVAASQSTWGKAYKYFDLKTVFLGSLALFEAGSLICALSKNSPTLIVGRAITGIGSAGVLAGCYTIVALAVPPEKRPAFAGILGATYGVGSVVGPMLGGVFTDRVSGGWRWCFWINLPLGFPSALIILFTFKTPPNQRTSADANMPLREKLLQMDLLGTFIIMAAITCFLLALQYGGVTYAWSEAKVIGLLVGFVALVVVFITVEWWMKTRALMVPHVVKRRVVWVGCLFSFLLGGCFFTLLYYLPIYFQAMQGVSAEQSGVRNLALIIAITITAILTGTIISAIGYFTPSMVLGTLLSLAGTILITLTFKSSTPARLWIPFQIVTGLGLGTAFQAPIMGAQALSPIPDVSATTAILLFFQTIGGAVFVSVAQSCFANILIKEVGRRLPGDAIDARMLVEAGATGLRNIFKGVELEKVLEAYMEGLKVVFLLCAVLAGASFLVGLGMPWVSVKRGHAKADDEEETEGVST